MNLGTSYIASALARKGLPDGVGHVDAYGAREVAAREVAAREVAAREVAAREVAGGAARGGWYAEEDSSYFDPRAARGGEGSSASSSESLSSDEGSEWDEESTTGIIAGAIAGGAAALKAFDRADAARGALKAFDRADAARGALAARPRGIAADAADTDDLLQFSELLKTASDAISRLASRRAPRTIEVGGYSTPESEGDDPRDKAAADAVRGGYGSWSNELPDGIVTMGDFIGPSFAGAEASSEDEYDEREYGGGEEDEGEYGGDEDVGDEDVGYKGYMAGGEDGLYESCGQGGQGKAGWSILDYAA